MPQYYASLSEHDPSETILYCCAIDVLRRTVVLSSVEELTKSVYHIDRNEVMLTLFKMHMKLGIELPTTDNVDHVISKCRRNKTAILRSIFDNFQQYPTEWASCV
jgi:hypothetical protein